MKKKAKSFSKLINSPLRKIVFGLTTFACGIASSYVMPDLRQQPHAEPLSILAIPKVENERPVCATAINRPCYSLSYDHRTKNASWVYERLTAENLKGDTNRGNFPFKEDPVIEKIFRSTLQDYRGSVFDRGHLATAANHKCNPEAMADTFYLSNMSPQDPQFNRGYWSKPAKHVRVWQT